jgi:hypothetical protein
MIDNSIKDIMRDGRERTLSDVVNALRRRRIEATDEEVQYALAHLTRRGSLLRSRMREFGVNIWRARQ